MNVNHDLFTYWCQLNYYASVDLFFASKYRVPPVPPHVGFLHSLHDRASGEIFARSI